MERLHSRPDPAAGPAHRPADWRRRLLAPGDWLPERYPPPPSSRRGDGSGGVVNRQLLAPFDPSPGVDWTKGPLNRRGAGTTAFCLRPPAGGGARRRARAALRRLGCVGGWSFGLCPATAYETRSEAVTPPLRIELCLALLRAGPSEELW